MSVIESIKRKWRHTFGSRKWHAEFIKAGFGTLSNYNSEVSRGIVHTDEWKEEMRTLQEKCNHSIRLEDGAFFDTRKDRDKGS